MNRVLVLAGCLVFLCAGMAEAGEGVAVRRVASIVVPTPEISLDVVTLVSGDSLRGRIVEDRGRFVVLFHPDLGRLTIARSRIADIQTAEEAARAARDAASEKESEQDTNEGGESDPGDASQIDFKARKEWDFAFTFGSTITNDDEGEGFAVSTELRADRVRPTSETHARLSYYFELDDGETDDHQATLLIDQRVRRAGSSWYWTGRPRYDFDEFRSWRHRLQIHGALGHFLIEEADTRWSFEFGAGYRRDYGAENATDVYEGMLGTVLDWRLSDRQKVGLDLRYYPQWDSDDLRVVTRFDWGYRLSDEGDLSLRVGLEHEYATDPDPGFPRNNYRFITGVELRF